MDVALRALNRFGLGARVGEKSSLGDPKDWLRSQLQDRDAPGIDGLGIEDAVDALVRERQALQSRDQERLMAARRRLREIQATEVTSALSARVASRRPFVERLVAFWSNHVCVSVVGEPRVAALAGHYERTVVRPHVLGTFEDMVLASAKHPAMLVYLDNFQSIGPSSPAARQAERRGRERGLNENYARELLELHTVGVEGGYSQEDVQELAKVLTGWTVAGLGPGARPNERPGFAFRPGQHEPGSKAVLGRRYGQAGVREGEQVIRDLCARPETATFVATKLVRHFVTDVPPMSAVERIADVFRSSGGDLREVSLALVELPEAWAPESRKFRTPQDWLVAALRSVGAEEMPPRLGQQLGQLRHPLWGPTAPKGFGDTEGEWADPDALMNRGELARTLAGPLARGRRLDPSRMLDVVDVPDGDPLRTLLADRSIGPRDRLALVFGGPAFQWR